MSRLILSVARCCPKARREGYPKGARGSLHIDVRVDREPEGELDLVQVHVLDVEDLCNNNLGPRRNRHGHLQASSEASSEEIVKAKSATLLAAQQETGKMGGISVNFRLGQTYLKGYDFLCVLDAQPAFDPWATRVQQSHHPALRRASREHGSCVTPNSLDHPVNCWGIT